MYAIYTRQSVFKEDSISVESQIEFCLHETKGGAYKTYPDKGYSGKNTDRPHFQEMLQDIRNGLIDTVVVYKLDRISRSILDFANLMELFQQYHVDFISSTEKFDTSTPMGRAMLNICIIFAQLERETTQQRVTDAYYSRSQKGFYMGGRVPYGFRRIPATIQGIKTSKYEIVPDEAEQIRLMYELYAKPHTSFGAIVKYFEEHGILKNGKRWDRARLSEYLRNPIYVKADQAVYEFYKGQGAIITNDAADFIGTNGCYLYKGPDAKGRKSNDLENQLLTLAPHEGFISSDIWLKCRTKCLNNKQIQPGRSIVHTWLAGKIKCGNCGYALTRKHYKNRNAIYYFCSNKMNSHGCGGCGTIFAREFEALIYREMCEKLKSFEVLNSEQKSQNSQINNIENELAKVEEEIEKLLEKLANANEVLTSYINKKVLQLDAQKRELLKKLSTQKTEAKSDTKQIRSYLENWDALTVDDKRLVVDTLIEVIHATSERVEIKWKI